MSVDEEEVHNIKMKDIYKCVMSDGKAVPAEIRNKVEPWIGRTHFAMKHPVTGVRMMYTPMTSTRLHFERLGAWKILVVCVPKGAKVKMIAPEDVEEFAQDSPAWLE
jgi:hypothetical protein